MNLQARSRVAATSAAALTLIPVALATFTAPGTPDFRGLSGAEFAGWDNFTQPLFAANLPDDPGTTGPASFSIVQAEPGALITGAGNIYSPAGGQDYTLTHTPDPARLNPDLTRLAVQIQTQGTELDYASVRLTFAGAGGASVTLAPDVQTELARVSLGGQGFAVETQFEWLLTQRGEVIADYTVQWNGAGAHMSLDAVLVDAYFAEDSASYCTAGTSTSGCQATLSATGTASATAGSGFVLHAVTVEGLKDGLFFYGANGRQANPWGNGSSFQCVAPPVKRGGLLSATGSSGACDGSFAQDLNARWCPSCPKPSQNFGAGAVIQAQLWFRDPANTSNQTTSLSDAIEFTVAP